MRFSHTPPSRSPRSHRLFFSSASVSLPCALCRFRGIVAGILTGGLSTVVGAAAYAAHWAEAERFVSRIWAEIESVAYGISFTVITRSGFQNQPAIVVQQHAPAPPPTTVVYPSAYASYPSAAPAPAPVAVTAPGLTPQQMGYSSYPSSAPVPGTVAPVVGVQMGYGSYPSAATPSPAPVGYSSYPSAAPAQQPLQMGYGQPAPGYQACYGPPAVAAAPAQQHLQMGYGQPAPGPIQTPMQMGYGQNQPKPTPTQPMQLGYGNPAPQQTPGGYGMPQQTPGGYGNTPGGY